MTSHEVFLERAAFEDEGPRDSRVMRWMKFGSILVVLPIAAGLGLALEEYLRVSHRRLGDSYVRVSFMIGASAGAILAVAYVVRCIAQDKDP